MCMKNKGVVMKKSIIPFVIIFITVLAFLTNCSRKPVSAGKYFNMVLIANDENFQDNEKKEQLIELVSHPRELNHIIEEQFTIIDGSSDNILKYKYHRSIFMFVKIGESSQAGYYASNQLTEEEKQKIRNGAPLFLIQRDVWAIGQTVFLFVYDEYQNLPKYIEKYKESIHKELDKYTREQEARRIWLAGWHEINYEKRGWFMKIPKPYLLVQDSVKKDIHCIQYKRKDIDIYRSAAVGWKEMSQQEFDKLGEDDILSIRDTMAWYFYDEDVSVYDETQVKVEKFKDYEGFYLNGAWENDKYYVGGLYQSRIFYVPEQSRLYILDGSVFAPNEDKFRYLMQFLNIFDTFIVNKS